MGMEIDAEQHPKVSDASGMQNETSPAGANAIPTDPNPSAHKGNSTILVEVPSAQSEELLAQIHEPIMNAPDTDAGSIEVTLSSDVSAYAADVSLLVPLPLINMSSIMSLPMKMLSPSRLSMPMPSSLQLRKATLLTFQPLILPRKLMIWPLPKLMVNLRVKCLRPHPTLNNLTAR